MTDACTEVATREHRLLLTKSTTSTWPSDIDVLRLAVVDDHEIVAFGIQGAYEKVGQKYPVEITWFPTVDAVRGPVDVIILDLRLDDDSTPADNLMRLASLGVPVVVYTSADDPRMVREAIRYGALSVVRKSSSPAELVNTVEAARNDEIMPGLDWAAAMDADTDFVATHLSRVEAEVLAHYAAGELSDVVAKRLGLAKSSVNTYVSRIRNKYRRAGRKADSRVDLLFRAHEDGILSLVEAQKLSKLSEEELEKIAAELAAEQVKADGISDGVASNIKSE